jgi:hypothetical protein
MWRAELEAIQIEIPTQGNAERNTRLINAKQFTNVLGGSTDGYWNQVAIFYAFPS